MECDQHRRLIVVDVETTGLDPRRHVPVEVAAVNVATGETLHFVPHLSGKDLSRAAGEALRINRYFEWGLFRQALPEQQTVACYSQLWEMLDCNVFAGCNPRFDAAMLCNAYRGLLETADHDWLDAGEVWHYRLADLSAHAAGALGVGAADLAGLASVCRSLGVVNAGEHTALGDANCFRQLAARPDRAAGQAAAFV